VTPQQLANLRRLDLLGYRLGVFEALVRAERELADRMSRSPRRRK
jgi:hypothetical protein